MTTRTRSTGPTSTRRGFLRRGAGLAAVASVPGLLASVRPAFAADDDARWEQLRERLLDGRPVIEDDGVLLIDAPGRAHDPAIVPITIGAIDPMRTPRRVHLIVDRNPLPLAGVFEFTEAGAAWRAMETRIRINEYTPVRAIGELDDGTLHMAQTFVKASGGCSAPAGADMEAAMARVGRMRLMLDELAADVEGQSEARIAISHPNNSGMQFDQVTRHYIPAFYVETIEARLGDVPLLRVETNFSLSENPSIRLTLRGETEAAPLHVLAVDSEGNRYEGSHETS